MYYPETFSDFCNQLINDMNTLVFDGLLAMEVIKTFEDLRDEDADVYGQLP